MDGAFNYPVETFSESEAQLLVPHFTNLDRPVFAVVGLPEAVKAGLFARYSRYEGGLRRLYLDEFSSSLPAAGGWVAGNEGERAQKLFERVFVGFGDDSVAQLGGAHIACEWCSNILTKILQRPRIGVAYLEQSTRYIPYDREIAGLGYRYYRDPRFGPQYEQAMDELFKIYSAGYRWMYMYVAKQFPLQEGQGQSEAAWSRAVTAKALDLLRGLLPAASLSHMGIYASGQAYENLIQHLLASPLAEARDYGHLMLTELKQVIPSFLSRIERPERGGRWIDYLSTREAAAERWAARLGINEPQGPAGPSVKLLSHTGSVEQLLAALVYEGANSSYSDTLQSVDALSAAEKTLLLKDLVGERENRRHKPGRGFEALNYVFEIECDYAGFRDLQRHRPLTIQWQWPTPALGAAVPPEVDDAGYGDEYRRALEISQIEHDRLADEGFGLAASYAVCLGYRMRFTLALNAREAMHLIELRSGVQGHPSYRAVAQEMYRLICEVHPEVGAAMSHIDLTSEPQLERLLSEMRNEAQRARLERNSRS